MLTITNLQAAIDGKEIWRAKYPSGGYSLIARPIFVNGLLIIQTGYDTAHLFALDPTGTGDGKRTLLVP